MKFYRDIFVVDKVCAENLQHKKTLFQEKTKTKKAIFMTLITLYGASENQNYAGVVDNQITADALFG